MAERAGVVQELRDSVASHGREYPHGDWKAANERISAARQKLDEMFGIETLGLLSNEMVLKITGRKAL